MNFCPEDGHVIGFDKLEKREETDHYFYSCHGYDKHSWEEVKDKSGKLLRIVPIKR